VDSTTFILEKNLKNMIENKVINIIVLKIIEKQRIKCILRKEKLIIRVNKYRLRSGVHL